MLRFAKRKWTELLKSVELLILNITITAFDIEDDLETHRFICLVTLKGTNVDGKDVRRDKYYKMLGSVKRAEDIFEEPQFYKDRYDLLETKPS